jgi:hypothetical protein
MYLVSAIFGIRLEAKPSIEEKPRNVAGPRSSGAEVDANKKDSLTTRARELINQTSETLDTAEKKITGELSSKDWRRDKRFALFVNYAAFDLFLPGKKGASAVFMESEDNSWELEYLKADIAVPLLIQNLGAIEETRISLLKRSFWGSNSFSGYFGLSFNSLSVTLGDELLSKLTNGAVPNSNLLVLNSIGLNAGVGNRWTIWKGVTYGADWIGFSQPLLTTRRDAKVLDFATN